MEFYDVIEIEKAKKKIKKNFLKIKKKQCKVSIFNSIGLKLIKDCFSRCNLPDFNKSTVDGYAVIVKNIFGASPSFAIKLNVKDTICIGEKTNIILKENDTVKVMTGSMIPKNATGVLKIEETEKINEKEILIFKNVHQNENIVLKNEDIKKGQKIFKKGHILKSQDIALLGSIGISKVEVEKKFNIGIISTGNELISLNEKIIFGKTRDINGILLKNELKKIKSVNSFYFGILKDNIKKIKKSIINSLNINDILIISGGSSVGEKDYIFEIIDSLGEIIFHGLSMKPGKPTIVGNINNKLIIALPGHPLACYFVFKILIEPLFSEKMYDDLKPYVEGILSKNIKSNTGCSEYIPVNINNGIIYPLFGKSALFNILCKSNGYIEVPLNLEGLKKNSKVKVFLL